MTAKHLLNPADSLERQTEKLLIIAGALMRRVEAARPLRLGLRAAERSAALHRFAAAFLPLYADRKTLRGALDFDDLIARAKALLTDPAVADALRGA